MWYDLFVTESRPTCALMLRPVYKYFGVNIQKAAILQLHPTSTTVYNNCNTSFTPSSATTILLQHLLMPHKV